MGSSRVIQRCLSGYLVPARTQHFCQRFTPVSRSLSHSARMSARGSGQVRSRAPLGLPIPGKVQNIAQEARRVILGITARPARIERRDVLLHVRREAEPRRRAKRNGCCRRVDRRGDGRSERALAGRRWGVINGPSDVMVWKLNDYGLLATASMPCGRPRSSRSDGSAPRLRVAGAAALAAGMKRGTVCTLSLGALLGPQASTSCRGTSDSTSTAT